MLAFKLAIRNLISGGLKTWLNVFVLSLSFVLLVFYNGMIDGWDRQAQVDTQAWEIAEGQYWVPGYDKYDPFTIQDAHQKLTPEVQGMVASLDLVPILIREGSAYPQGRQLSVLIKGMDLNQSLLEIPIGDLTNVQDPSSALILGSKMAKTLKLGVGDDLLLRWRDANGAFDAKIFKIASVFDCDVPSIDVGQVYVDIEILRHMCAMPDEASILVSNNSEGVDLPGWEFQSIEVLMADMIAIINSKRSSGYVMTFLILLIALLAIFDTQVFSVFRRQKEIGTYIALGMTRRRVVSIFTIEGATNSVFAGILAAIYSTPLFIYLAKNGIYYGEAGEGTGMTIGEYIYPYYSFSLIATAVILIVVSATIVSYLPSRKIAKINPTEALRGKVS
jgi:putative ABC transport system permease protein